MCIVRVYKIIYDFDKQIIHTLYIVFIILCYIIVQLKKN